VKGRWVIDRLLLVAFAGLLAIPALGPVLMENALHVPPDARHTAEPKFADAAADGIGVWLPAEMNAADGSVLRAWLFRPLAPNGRAVIVLHGVADSRTGVLAQTRMLLQHGYTVLAPDSRGHGESQEARITYGLLEAEDIHRWADWLYAREQIKGLYGLGESMGAADLLQALPREPRFRAVVAECPFYDFRQVAFSRLAEGSGVDPRVGKWLFRPMVESGFLYARWRYGLNLADASPAKALGETTIPVFLIHGSEDRNIPPEQSEWLAAQRPQSTVFWRVAGAGHIEAFSKEPGEFSRRVLDWFESHR